MVQSSFNTFEWIADNKEFYPILSDIILKGNYINSDVSISALGCGSSKIEELATFNKSVNVKKVVGYDISKDYIEESRERYKSLSLTASSSSSKSSVVEWHEAVDLGEFYYSAEEVYDVVYDKGTLDHLICEETSKLAVYLRNVKRMMLTKSESKSKYVLISFRNRELLVNCVESAGFKLVKEEEYKNPATVKGSSSQPGYRCLVFELESVPSSESDLESITTDTSEQLNILTRKLTAHIDAAMATLSFIKKPLSGEGDADDSTSEAFNGDFEAVYKKYIPKDLQAEYSFKDFLGDIKNSMEEVYERGNFKDVGECEKFLEENM